MRASYLRLYVNIDHVATVRQARRGDEPDPVAAALLCESAGADGITAHLREDRRHIQDADVARLRSSLKSYFNLELACTDEMIDVAMRIHPDQVTLVPERREEVTTEGGLDVARHTARVEAALKRLKSVGIRTSLFIAPDLDAVRVSREIGADAVELHTGEYANNSSEPATANALRDAAGAAAELGLAVHAGHGLTARNLAPVASYSGDRRAQHRPLDSQPRDLRGARGCSARGARRDGCSPQSKQSSSRQFSSDRVKKHFRAVLGLVISAALLWWVLRQTSPSEIMRVLEHANPWLLAVATVCSTLIFPLRARRWRTILDPIYPKLPFGPLWRATAIGMMVNNVVPARAGEVARAYVLTRETPVPFSTSIASLAVDRVFDAIVLLILAFAAVFDPAFPHGVRIGGQSVVSWAIGGTALVAILVALLYALVFFPAQLIRVFELFARKLSPKLEERGKAALVTFSEGLSVLRSPGHCAAVLGWTILHWLVNGLGWWIAMIAVGIHVPFSASLVLQALVALGVAVPAAPGYFGVFETVSRIGLGIYAVSAGLATSWALGFHILSFLPITVFGAVYAARLNLNLKELQSQRNAA